MTEQKNNTNRPPTGFLSVDFSQISEPGAYLTRRGELLRVPPEALAEGHSPLIAWETQEGNVCTRISENPYAPISKCRQVAADLDLPVRF